MAIIIKLSASLNISLVFFSSHSVAADWCCCYYSDDHFVSAERLFEWRISCAKRNEFRVVFAWARWLEKIAPFSPDTISTAHSTLCVRLCVCVVCLWSVYIVMCRAVSKMILITHAHQFFEYFLFSFVFLVDGSVASPFHSYLFHLLSNNRHLTKETEKLGDDYLQTRLMYYIYISICTRSHSDNVDSCFYLSIFPPQVTKYFLFLLSLSIFFLLPW